MITDLSQTTVIINDYDRLIMLIMRGVTGEVGFFPTNSLPFFSNIFYVPHVGVISVRLKSQCTLGRTALVAFSTGHFPELFCHCGFLLTALRLIIFID